MRIEPVGIFEPSAGITYVTKVNPAIREANIQIREKRELQEKRVNGTRYMNNMAKEYIDTMLSYDAQGNATNPYYYLFDKRA